MTAAFDAHDSENGYWDQLEWIIRTAQMLQKCPVPETNHECMLLRTRIDDTEHHIRKALEAIRPYVSVWCGDPKDSLRGTAVPCDDWDWLWKNYNSRNNGGYKS